MSLTQIHLIDQTASLVLVVCSDGGRVLFGSHAGAGTADDAVQRLFEILEDGRIDYLVHQGVEPQGISIIEPMAEFFPVLGCLEPEGCERDAPESYLALRVGRVIETLNDSEVFEIGETQIRLFQAAAVDPDGGRGARPVALHVSHGDGAGRVLCPGATTGLDWMQISGPGTDLRAAGLIVDGRRPLDIVVTAPRHGTVSADHLRAIAPSTIILGAESNSAGSLRMAARELYSHFVRRASTGAGLVEVTGQSWATLTLDADGVRLEREERSISKVA